MNFQGIRILGIVIVSISLSLVLRGLYVMGENLDWGLIWIGAGFMMGGFGGEATVTLPFIGNFAGVGGIVILIVGLIGLVV